MSHTIECPVCDAKISLDNDTLSGELIECHECGSELEVASLEPISLQVAPQTEEDWGQ